MDNDHQPDNDVRPNPGIHRSPLDEIKAIQTLLTDVYEDRGDGRTLVRELVQNADDARARRLTLTVVDKGWPEAENSLLHGPALLVANDGPFSDKDRKAMHMAIGGSKEDDVDKVGTFGIGLKSVFHICEAFVYIGAAQSQWQAGVLNPWYGTGQLPDRDPLHPDWDSVGGQDQGRLGDVAKHLLGETDGGLLLWIPLRRPEHDRGTAGNRFWLGKKTPEPKDLCSWFDCPTSAALLLAQCGHLQSIKAMRAVKPGDLSDGGTLMRVTRRGARWLGRYPDDSRPQERGFGGEIESEGSTKWSVVGVEALGGQNLRKMRDHPDWPRLPRAWSDRHGQYVAEPRKALAHAAVTVLRPDAGDSESLGTRLRWAAFLPLDDHPRPSSSEIVKGGGPSPGWEIILHGYFWPSQDRRSIPGVADERSGAAGADERSEPTHADEVGEATSPSTMRETWNRTLCEDLLLPLLPGALARAVDGVDEGVARKMLGQVGGLIDAKRMACVTRRHWLLPVVDRDGVRWRAVDADAEAPRVLSIPNWARAPRDVREQFLDAGQGNASDPVFTEHDAPRFGGDPDDWTREHLGRLLKAIPVAAFAAPDALEWVGSVIGHALGPKPHGDDELAAVVAEWLVRRIREGALAPTVRRSVSKKFPALREAWRNLGAALPSQWVLATPVATLRAVGKLAEGDGVMGRGLVILPVGRGQSHSGSDPCPDQTKLDAALRALGRPLRHGGESKELRDSRLLLAENLLCVRRHGPVDDELGRLPIIRAVRLPDSHSDAWSIADVRDHLAKHRVLSTPVGSSDKKGGPTTAPEESSSADARGAAARTAPGPKRAVSDVAHAIGEPMWLVTGNAVSAMEVHVPPPEPRALIETVLTAKAFGDHESRAPLLRWLAPSIESGRRARRAVRALLAGHPADEVGDAAEMFQVRSGQDGVGRAVSVFLRLLAQPWRALDTSLGDSLPQGTLAALGISTATRDALRRLLDECLQQRVDWSKLSEGELLHLIGAVPSTHPQDKPRWCSMPLHRHVEGHRAAFDHRALRWKEGASVDADVPKDLRADVRLLDPDREVSHLYDDVPESDRDGLLRRMLKDPRPWRFCGPILQRIAPDGDSIMLPSDHGLRRLLRERSWLSDERGEAIAPQSIVIVPDEMLHAVDDLARKGALGDKCLPNAVALPIRRKAERVVRQLRRMGIERQVERLAGMLDPDRVAVADDGAWLVMSDQAGVDPQLLKWAQGSPLVTHHPGWQLVNAAHRALSRRTGEWDRDPKPLLGLAKSLCGPVSPGGQVKMLSILADEKPPKDSPTGRMFRALLSSFVGTDGFWEDVLPSLDLPAQDGHWHPSEDIAVTETGVARRHLLIPELRTILRRDESALPSPSAAGFPDGETIAWESLIDYFERWRGRVRNSAVGAFLCLLGRNLRGPDIERLARAWLGTDVSVAGMRADLCDSASDEDPWAGLRVRIAGSVQRGDRVRARNVLGIVREMEATSDNDTVFAIDPQLHPARRWGKNPRDAFWEIKLREIDPRSRTGDELMRLLGGTVERWAVRCLGLDRGRVREWWARWGESSQAEIGPVIASIKAHLPLTLRQLGVRSHQGLSAALREAERAQRRREQAPSERSVLQEREALEILANLVGTHDNQRYLWMRVNELISRYGYRDDSVLLELAQNADDALAEAAEINGRSLPGEFRCLRVQAGPGGDDGNPTVNVTHWGRPINDTGGAAFLGGRDRQWDQDLYFMMLMNLSGKPGETPGEGSVSATTGRFGLGFKSVHLVSPCPSVVSGSTAFSIAGGLLPSPEPLPVDAEKWSRRGRQATRIELPLREDSEAEELLRSMFRRFSYARVLLPVFSRQVREVVVEGGPCPGKHSFDGTPVDDAPGWSVGGDTDFPGLSEESWQILRFRPSDAGVEGSGTAAVAFGLRDGLPAALPSGMPFLWNVTPTSEEWGCGYVVNGPFKLDPGRTHVSLDDEPATREAARRLGEALGKGLIALHDALMNVPQGCHPVLGSDPREFSSSLWTVLTSGTDTPDRLRESFLRCLHGPGRGISAWMDKRAVVPTNLSAPFPKRLPPRGARTSWEVAVDGLDSKELCAALASIDDEHFRRVVGRSCIVSGETDRLLRRLRSLSISNDGSAAPNQGIGPSLRRRVGPSLLLARLVECWDGLLTAEQLQALRPLAGVSTWRAMFAGPGGAPLGQGLHAESVTRDLRPLDELLVRGGSGVDRDEEADARSIPSMSDADLDDDTLLAAFAPSDQLLARDYIGDAEDRTMFRWLRGRPRVDASQVARWCRDVREDLRPNALRYLLHGTLRDAVLEHVRSSQVGTSWLHDLHAVSHAVEGLPGPKWQRDRVMESLFPDRLEAFDRGRREATIATPPEAASAFFRRLSGWWDNPAVRNKVVDAYEICAWPGWLLDSNLASSLRSESDDHWLGLLVLGSCRRLGRTKAEQHRGFLDFLHERGWWEVFKNPDDTRAWMRILREWQDDQTNSRRWQRWMSLFPAIYWFSRYLDDYRSVLRTADHPGRSEAYQIDTLFNPRDDPALSGAGAGLAAPRAPLDMGRHWILRELVRLGVIDGHHLYPDCWVPADQVLRFLDRLGLELPAEGTPNPDKARAISDFLAEHLDTEAPTLHRAFDIPFRHLDGNADLCRRLGLDD